MVMGAPLIKQSVKISVGQVSRQRLSITPEFEPTALYLMESYIYMYVMYYLAERQDQMMNKCQISYLVEK